MGNLNKILGGLLIAALIYIIFLEGCGDKHSCPKGEIIEVDTVLNSTVIDTNWFDTTIVKYLTIQVPEPYYDTTHVYDTLKRYTLDDFDEFTERPQIYEDSIGDDTVSINYKIKVWGFIDDIDIGYTVLTPYSIEKTTIIQTEVVKKKAFNGFYVGMDADIGKDGLKRPTPVIEVSTDKINYNLGYNVNDKEFRAGIRFRIGKK